MPRNLPFETDLVAQLDGESYFVLTRTQAEGVGGRQWAKQFETAQESPPQRMPIPIPTFHEGSGFTYAGMPSTYEQAGAPPSGTANGSGWDASVVGRLSTWSRHGVGTSVVTTIAKRGWLLQLGQFLYMARGRYLTKYIVNTTAGATWTISGTDRDLGSANVVPGRPAVWNGKIYLPSSVSSTGALNVWQQVTQGSPDTYANGPSGKEATCFRPYKRLLARAQTNGVATCATTPTTAANWSDDSGNGLYNADDPLRGAGDPNTTITDLVEWELYLFAGKEDGVWSYTDDLQTRNELSSLSAQRATENCSPLSVHIRDVLIPHISGLIRWVPGEDWNFNGPEQEGALEGDLTPGWGLCVGTIPYGPMTFAVYKDTVNTRGSIVGLYPGRGQRDPVPHMHVQCTNGYFENGCIVQATTGETYLAVIHTSSDGLTAEPWLWRLPRAGLSPANDPSVPKAVSNTTFFTSRYFGGNRNVVKTWREVEFWLEMTAVSLSNTPGLQVWARIDEGSAIQLRDSTDTAATVKTEGSTRLFFPKDSTAVGHYCQLEFRIPAIADTQTALAIDAIRDLVVRASYRPRVGGLFKVPLVLSDGEFEDGRSMQRTVEQQVADLEALAGANTAPVSYAEPFYGRTGYATVEALEIREVEFKGSDASAFVAVVTLRDEPYS